MAQHEVLEAAKAIASKLVDDRRKIHQFPELAYEEERTSTLVAQRLEQLGLEVETGVAKTGVIGLLRGAKPGRTVLLRADMDALPIQEQHETLYRSQKPGLMHACGHDGHTSMLLGAAQLLKERQAEISGAVKFMFQPAEEGGAGALRMIEAGLMENPKVDAAFALHVHHGHYVGQIGLRVGPMLAASDRFSIVVRGRGGHAARPNLAVDPIVIAAQIITALQTLVSRESAPQDEAVVTVGSLHAGTAPNVIPDTALIEGTVRTYSNALQDHLERRIVQLATGIAKAMNGDADVEYKRGYPPLINHLSGVQIIQEAAAEVLGDGAVVETEMSMGGEDFAYLLQRVPGAMFRLGVRSRDWQEIRPIHSSDFDLDEEALPIGAAVMAATALRFLAREA